MDDLTWVLKFLATFLMIAVTVAVIQGGGMKVYKEWKRWRELRHHQKVTGEELNEDSSTR